MASDARSGSRELLKIPFKPKSPTKAADPARTLKFEEPSRDQLVTIFNSSEAPAPFTDPKHYQQLQRRMRA